MQTPNERRRLLSEFEHGPIDALATVLKCVAGFAILLFVVAGPWSVLNMSDRTEVAGDRHKVAQVAQSAPRPMATVKRAFDERRQRFVSTSSQRRVVVDTRD